MTTQEWTNMAAKIAAWWGNFPPERAAAYYEALGDQDAERVAIALRSLLMDGEKFAPTAAQIIAKLHEQDAANTPTFVQALGLATSAVHRFRDDAKALAWLAEAHPVVGAWARAVGMEALRYEEVTSYAQTRWGKAYEEVRAQVQSGERLAIARGDTRPGLRKAEGAMLQLVEQVVPKCETCGGTRAVLMPGEKPNTTNDPQNDPLYTDCPECS